MFHAHYFACSRRLVKLGLRDRWPQNFTALDWVCGLLVVPEPVFILLAIAFGLAERPQAISEYRPNPDCDPRKLY